MSLLSLIDRIMGTASPDIENPDNQSREIRAANREINKLDHDISEIDVAVSIAETRLRSRGWTPGHT